jgi:hypothetical protein
MKPTYATFVVLLLFAAPASAHGDMGVVFWLAGCVVSHVACLAVAIAAPPGLRGRLLFALAAPMGVWWLMVAAMPTGTFKANAWLAMLVPWLVLLLMQGRHATRNRRR